MDMTTSNNEKKDFLVGNIDETLFVSLEDAKKWTDLKLKDEN